MYDQTCFNRLATDFKISMFGHQTMFDGVWSPNISRLSRPLRCISTDDFKGEIVSIFFSQLPDGMLPGRLHVNDFNIFKFELRVFFL